jgi:hypothetical protein
MAQAGGRKSLGNEGAADNPTEKFIAASTTTTGATPATKKE